MNGTADASFSGGPIPSTFSRLTSSTLKAGPDGIWWSAVVASGDTDSRICFASVPSPCVAAGRYGSLCLCLEGMFATPVMASMCISHAFQQHVSWSWLLLCSLVLFSCLIVLAQCAQPTSYVRSNEDLHTSDLYRSQFAISAAGAALFSCYLVREVAMVSTTRHGVSELACQAFILLCLLHCSMISTPSECNYCCSS
jgi:hypothetical protein